MYFSKKYFIETSLFKITRYKNNKNIHTSPAISTHLRNISIVEYKKLNPIILEMHTFQITLKMRGFRFALCASSVSHSLLNFSVSLAASFAFKFLYTSCAVNGFFNPNLKRSVKYLNLEMEEISHEILEI